MKKQKKRKHEGNLEEEKVSFFKGTETSIQRFLRTSETTCKTLSSGGLKNWSSDKSIGLPASESLPPRSSSVEPKIGEQLKEASQPKPRLVKDQDLEGKMLSYEDLLVNVNTDTFSKEVDKELYPRGIVQWLFQIALFEEEWTPQRVAEVTLLLRSYAALKSFLFLKVSLKHDWTWSNSFQEWRGPDKTSVMGILVLIQPQEMMYRDTFVSALRRRIKPSAGPEFAFVAVWLPDLFPAPPHVDKWLRIREKKSTSFDSWVRVIQKLPRITNNWMCLIPEEVTAEQLEALFAQMPFSWRAWSWLDSDFGKVAEKKSSEKKRAEETPNLLPNVNSKPEVLIPTASLEEKSSNKRPVVGNRKAKKVKTTLPTQKTMPEGEKESGMLKEVCESLKAQHLLIRPPLRLISPDPSQSSKWPLNDREMTRTVLKGLDATLKEDLSLKNSEIPLVLNPGHPYWLLRLAENPESPPLRSWTPSELVAAYITILSKTVERWEADAKEAQQRERDCKVREEEAKLREDRLIAEAEQLKIEVKEARALTEKVREDGVLERQELLKVLQKGTFIPGPQNNSTSPSELSTSEISLRKLKEKKEGDKDESKVRRKTERIHAQQSVLAVQKPHFIRPRNVWRLCWRTEEQTNASSELSSHITNAEGIVEQWYQLLTSKLPRSSELLDSK